MYLFYGIVFKWLVLKLFFLRHAAAYANGYYSNSEEIVRPVQSSYSSWTDDSRANARTQVARTPWSTGYFSFDRRRNYLYAPKYNSEKVPKRAHVTTNSSKDYTATKLFATRIKNTNQESGNKSLSIPISYSHTTVMGFPVFFTNPATGIIYAITVVGRLRAADGNTTLSSDSMNNNNNINNNNNNNIKTTKNREDVVGHLLKQPNEKLCADAISSYGNCNRSNQSRTTPSLSASPPSDGLPSIPPPPVLLQTELTVQDQLRSTTPLRRSAATIKATKLQRKRRKKFKKRPGRHPSTTTAVTAAVTETYPKIILGKMMMTNQQRPTRLTARAEESLRTQLEKPLSLPLRIGGELRSFEFMQNISGKFHSERKRNSVRFRREALYNKFDAVKKETSRENASVTATTAEAEIQNPEKQTALTTRTTTTTTATATSVKPEIIQSNPEKSKVFIMKKRAPEKRPSSGALFKPRPIKRHNKKRHNNSKRKQQDSYDYDYFELSEEEEEEQEQEMEEYDDDYEYKDENQHRQRTKNKYAEDRVKKEPNAQKMNEIFVRHQQQQAANSRPGTLKEDNSKVGGSESSAAENLEYGFFTEVTQENAATSETAERVQGEQYSEEDGNADEDGEQDDDDDDYSSQTGIQKPPHTKIKDYYDDEEDEGGGGIGAFFHMLFYPLHLMMEKLFGNYENGDTPASSDQHQPEHSYTLYHNGPVHSEAESSAAEAEEGSSLLDWFGSWFGLSWRRTTKKIGTSNATPPPFEFAAATEKPGSWLQSWFYGQTATQPPPPQDYDSDDNDNKWFSGWFDTNKFRPKRRRGTKPPPPPAPPLATAIPQVPILTIVDPMRNPQSWIGLLTHHITNGTTPPRKPPTPVVNSPAFLHTASKPNRPRRINYSKYQIWRLKPQRDDEVKTLEEYKASAEGAKLQWLKRPTLRGLNDVLVPPHMFTEFAATLSYESIAHEVIIFDVGKVIAYEMSSGAHQYLQKLPGQPLKHKKVATAPLSMSWQKYHQYDDIVNYLESMRLRYPQIVELIHIGRSYEGRPLIICKIESKQLAAVASETSAPHSTQRQRLRFKRKSGHANAIFIEAGMHGLEWIGPATSTWMISELLRIMKSNKTTNDVQESIKKTTWFILPVLNPDGYAYTHKYDRFWRKSRSRHVSRPGGGLISSAMTWLQKRQKRTERICHGVDLDSNWRYQWAQRGTSQSPCNEYYAGPVPFSEPETKALSEFLLDCRKQIKLYISLQAYGQVLSYPSNTNTSFNAHKVDDFLDVALVAIEALRKKSPAKSRYKIDSNSDFVGKRSGSADAFAAFEVGVPFSYTLHLADNGVHGYLLPSLSIEPTARDAFEIVTNMIDYIQ